MNSGDDLRAAQAHLARGQHKQALKAAKAALKRQPKSALAANVAGIALSNLGRHRDAVEMFRKAARLDPGFADARRNLAQAMILTGQPQVADRLMSRLTETDSGDAAAWYLLAQAKLALGDLGGADAAASRALEADETLLPAWRLRARIRDKMGRIDAAIADYQAVLARAPDDVETLVGISLPLARQRRTEEALAAAQRAVALAPGHAGAGMRLGMQLLELGRRDEAAAAFRRVLEAAPGHAPAIEQLARVQEAEANRDLAVAARAALKSAPRRSEARASLLFALAHMAEQAGDRDSADRYLAEANGIMAALRPYDFRADAGLNARILALFDGTQAQASAMPEGPRPIYVLGLPRSGTTLAEAILGAHPSVQPLGERAAAGAILYPMIEAGQPFDAPAIEAFVRQDRAMLPAMPEGTVAYVDKMPENYRLIGFLLSAYPDCRIVHLRRDPRDTALSMWKAHLDGTALSYIHDLKAMAHRFNLYAETMRHWHRIFPGRIFDLRYEAMVQDVAAASRELADRCGLEWSPAMARPDLSTEQILTATATQLRQPVHTRSIGRWRQHAGTLAPFIEGLDPELWPEIA